MKPEGSRCQARLAVLTLFAGLLRFYNLVERSFWIEERHTLWVLGQVFSFDEVIRTTRPIFFGL